MDRIIKSVHKHPCLWKVDAEGCNDIKTKVAAWKAVAKECRLQNAREAKMMWKKAKNKHLQAITKRKPKQAAPCNYEKSMEFLLPSMRRLSMSKNVTKQKHHGEKDQGSSNVQAKVSLEQAREATSAERAGSSRREIALIAPRGTVSVSSSMKSFFKAMMLTVRELPEAIQQEIQVAVYNVVVNARETYLTSTESSAVPSVNVDLYGY